LAYCAVVIVEDLDAVEVCCETVVACVELEVCDCVVSGFVFVIFPCGLDVLPLCLVGWGDGFLGEFLLCFLFGPVYTIKCLLPDYEACTTFLTYVHSSLYDTLGI
jgi:hypothetical protein